MVDLAIGKACDIRAAGGDEATIGRAVQYDFSGPSSLWDVAERTPRSPYIITVPQQARLPRRIAGGPEPCHFARDRIN